MSKLKQGCRVTHTKSYRLRMGKSEWLNDRLDGHTYMYTTGLLLNLEYLPQRTPIKVLAQTWY